MSGLSPESVNAGLDQAVFTEKEWQRYQRQIQLNGFGVEGQIKLKKAKVVIVGMGGLGVPVAMYLAGAGVGCIEMIDADTVSRSNLHRQVLYTESDIGKPKVLAAEAALVSRNPHITFVARNLALDHDNAASFFASADLILDCTDNFAARYLINDTCLALSKPWLFASIAQFAGQLALLNSDTACFRCLYPQAPERVADCNSAGVLGVLPGFIGMMQATEALKYLAGLNGSAPGDLLLAEPLNQRVKHLRLAPDPSCPCQASGKVNMPRVSASALCETERNRVDALSVSDYETDPASYFLIDVRSEAEHRAFNIGGLHLPFQADASAHFVRQFEAQVPEARRSCAVLYCQSGARSQRALALLHAQGIRGLKSLSGGLAALLDARLPND